MGGLQLLVKHWFIPDDVTPDYYHFTCWRMFQRFIAGTVNVFGTQVRGSRGGKVATGRWYRWNDSPTTAFQVEL